MDSRLMGIKQTAPEIGSSHQARKGAGKSAMVRRIVRTASNVEYVNAACPSSSGLHDCLEQLEAVGLCVFCI